MKTKVRVTLRAEQEVEIEVEHAEYEDPTDLSAREESIAISLASPIARWTIDNCDIRKV